MMNNYETVHGIDRCHADWWITWKQNSATTTSTMCNRLAFKRWSFKLRKWKEVFVFPSFLLFRGLVMKLQIIHNLKELCKNEPLILIRNLPSFQLGLNSTWSQKFMRQEHRNSPASPSLTISLPPPPWPTSMFLCLPDCLAVH